MAMEQMYFSFEMKRANYYRTVAARGSCNGAAGVSWASEASRSRALKGSDRGGACAAEGGPAGVWGRSPQRGPGAEDVDDCIVVGCR